MKKNVKATILTAGLFLGAFTSNAYADYVTGGDFTNSISTLQTYYAGSSFDGWNVTSGSVDLNGGYWQAPTSAPGSGSVDMDGNSPGAISQSIATGAGSFLLTFSLSGNPDGGNALKELEVSVGNALKTFDFTTGSNSHSNMGYVTETLAFTTTGPTNLVFTSLDSSGPYGAVIGGVSIAAVPLPAALPMFAAALLGMFGFYSFRKRQQLA